MRRYAPLPLKCVEQDLPGEWKFFVLAILFLCLGNNCVIFAQPSSRGDMFNCSFLLGFLFVFGVWSVSLQCFVSLFVFDLNILKCIAGLVSLNSPDACAQCAYDQTVLEDPVGISIHTLGSNFSSSAVVLNQLTLVMKIVRLFGGL